MTGGVTERTHLDATRDPKLLNRCVSPSIRAGHRVDASTVDVIVPRRAETVKRLADELHRAGCCGGSRATCEREGGVSYAAIAARYEAATWADAGRTARRDAASWVGFWLFGLVFSALIAESLGALRFEATPWMAATLVLGTLVAPVVLIYRRQLGAWVAALVRRPRRGLRKDRRVVVDRRR
jgi:hypothetical protein